MLAAQNAGFGAEGLGLMAEAAKVPASTAALNTAKAGISGLGSEAGRAAFMQGVGGVGGLAKKASMAAAPAMMVPEKTSGPTPTDDEMYAYDFDYGRTGADGIPTSISAEGNYFNPTFSKRRKIKAADYFNAAEGGLMRLAKGGETTSPSESDAALAYLMGESSGSSAGLPVMASQAPVVGSDNMYAFDPVTGTFLRNPNVKGSKSAAVGSRVGTSFSGGDGTVEMSPQTERFLSWEESTPEGRAHRDARMGEIQNLFNLGPTGALFSAIGGKEAKAPNFKTLFGTPDSYKSYIADKDSGIFEGRSQSGGSKGESWESLPADMRGGDGGGGVDHTSPGPGSNYGGEGEAAGGLISLADGGLMGLAKGGMRSGGFVVPADVVSMVGEGNTDAGYSRIKSMVPSAVAIKGKDGGQADTVKTHIEGKQPARVAHGEMYIPPETVKRMGGAKKLYAMMDRVRQQATGSKRQIKPVSLKQAMA
jgi:hypothetical protein